MADKWSKFITVESKIDFALSLHSLLAISHRHCMQENNETRERWSEKNLQTHQHWPHQHSVFGHYVCVCALVVSIHSFFFLSFFFAFTNIILLKIYGNGKNYNCSLLSFVVFLYLLWHIVTNCPHSIKYLS